MSKLPIELDLSFVVSFSLFVVSFTGEVVALANIPPRSLFLGGDSRVLPI